MADVPFVIVDASDIAGCDAMVARLQSTATLASHLTFDVALTPLRAYLVINTPTGVACSVPIDYPVRWEAFEWTLAFEDDLAVVRAEGLAAILTWMTEVGVPTSDDFEQVLRWVVFQDLALDSAHLAVLTDDGTPLELPVGFHGEWVSEDGDELWCVTEHRPYSAIRNERTWFLMRQDGWSALFLDRLDWIGTADAQTAVPDFGTLRLSGDGTGELWFQNTDVVADEWIAFSRAHYAISGRI